MVATMSDGDMGEASHSFARRSIATMACIFRRQVHAILKFRWPLTDDCHERSGKPRAAEGGGRRSPQARGNISGLHGMAPKADWDRVHEALGRVFASVPESTILDGYSSMSSITDSDVPACLKSLVNSADAEKAYIGSWVRGCGEEGPM